MRSTLELLSLLDNANVQAFLRVIREGEGTADEAGYRRMFGGRLFDSYADHPRIAITAGMAGKQYTSTAAGAYQFLARTWDGLVRQFGFADFEPATQDIAALALIDGRKALDDVIAGRLVSAIAKCAREWASLPGSPYGQPTRTMAQAAATYQAAGGAFVDAPAAVPQLDTATAPAPDAGPATSPESTTMPLPAILGALLPTIIEVIPKLGALFGSGSAVAERNVKAAELAVTIVQEAVGARNAQEAAEIVKADPVARQAAISAIEQRWFELSESGGGGIDGARKADTAAMAGSAKVWQSPSFLVAAALLPLVYLIVGSVIGLYGKEWSDDVRAAVANGVVGMVLGALVGYYFGQTTSRNRSSPPA